MTRCCVDGEASAKTQGDIPWLVVVSVHGGRCNGRPRYPVTTRRGRQKEQSWKGTELRSLTDTDTPASKNAWKE